MESPLLQLDADALARSEEVFRRKLGLEHGHQQPNHSIRAGHPRGQVEKDIPVVIVNERKTQPILAPMPDQTRSAEALEQALQHERGAREKLNHDLRQAQESIRQLQTKLAHVEIAHDEGIAAAQRAREQAEAAARDAKEALWRNGGARPVLVGRWRSRPVTGKSPYNGGCPTGAAASDRRRLCPEA